MIYLSSATRQDNLWNSEARLIYNDTGPLNESGRINLITAKTEYKEKKMQHNKHWLDLYMKWIQIKPIFRSFLFYLAIYFCSSLSLLILIFSLFVFITQRVEQWKSLKCASMKFIGRARIGCGRLFELHDIVQTKI